MSLPVVSQMSQLALALALDQGRAWGLGLGLQVQAQPAFTEPNNMLAHMSWNMHIHGTYIEDNMHMEAS